jgi:predicted methyltransferase
MKVLDFATVLALVACSGPKASPPPVAAPTSVGSADQAGSASGSVVTPADAAAPIPPYAPAADVPVALQEAISASDRSETDRRLDAGRKPGEVLAWFGIAPGQNVGELFAGRGYTTELLARTVGDKGHVWAENTKEILDKFARKPWEERAAKPVMKNVTALERPIDDPFGPVVKDLDAVIFILNYHDTVWMKADRTRMNKAVFAALKPGGVYGVVDHSAVAGSGERDVQALHRIDEEVVKKEVQAAGFQLASESDLLRNPGDARDWNASPTAAADKRGTSDRFVLRFVKPKK